MDHRIRHCAVFGELFPGEIAIYTLRLFAVPQLCGEEISSSLKITVYFLIDMVMSLAVVYVRLLFQIANYYKLQMNCR